MTNPLFQHIIEGNIEAYSGLYKEYYKKFYNYGKKFTDNKELIEDSIQEVFLDLWNRKEKLSHVESPNYYLYSSFRYTLLKKIKQRDKIVLGEAENDEHAFSAESIIIDKELNEEMRGKLNEAIKSLTGRQVEAVFLRFYEGLSYPEVAAMLNISVKATYKIVARSISALKEKILFLLIIMLEFVNLKIDRFL